MKKYLLAALLSASVTAQAQVPAHFCRDVTELAVYVMGYYQEGVPASRMYEAAALTQYSLLDDIIADAITYPKYSSLNAKNAVMQEFADKWRDGCIRATGAKL